MTISQALQNALFILQEDHNETCSCTLGGDYQKTIDRLTELQEYVDTTRFVVEYKNE